MWSIERDFRKPASEKVDETDVKINVELMDKVIKEQYKKKQYKINNNKRTQFLELANRLLELSEELSMYIDILDAGCGGSITLKTDEFYLYLGEDGIGEYIKEAELSVFPAEDGNGLEMNIALDFRDVVEEKEQ